jgi:hypothetical protein
MPFETALTRALGIKSLIHPPGVNLGKADYILRAHSAGRHAMGTNSPKRPTVAMTEANQVGYAELASAVSNAGGLGIV